MTELSLVMKDRICRYCGQATEQYCSADVPYYAVSMACKYFTDQKTTVRPVREAGMRRIMKRTLVETF